MDALPVLSQVKSLVQFISGDSEGAKETQENFSRQLPVVPQLRSLVECIKGDNDAARSTQESCGEFLLGALDGMPVIGHVKGGIHYALGQQDRGDQSMKAASRTVGVLGGGVGGFLVGGPLGAAVGGVSGGAAVDCLATGIHSATRREFTPSGQIAAWARVHQLAVSKDAPKAKIPALVFEAAVGITMDALSGYFAGESVRAFQAKAASGKVTSTAPVDGEMGSPPDFAAGANSVKPEPTYAGEPIPNEAWVEPGTELYRGDKVSPSSILKEGFKSKGAQNRVPLCKRNYDVFDHTKASKPNTNMVSTTFDYGVAKHFMLSVEEGLVRLQEGMHYVVAKIVPGPKSAINVVKCADLLKKPAWFLNECEATFINSIPSSFIKELYVYEWNALLGRSVVKQTIPNPAFVSPAAATATATAANHVMGLIPLSAAALITAEWVAQKDSLISTGAF